MQSRAELIWMALATDPRVAANEASQQRNPRTQSSESQP